LPRYSQRAGFVVWFLNMIRRRTIPSVATTALVALLFAQAGCKVSLAVGKKPQSKTSPETSATPPTPAPTSIQIPPDAQRISEGSDPTSFTADAPGTVYVFSRDDRKVALQYDLQAGESFTLSPASTGAAFTASRHLGSPGHGTLVPSAGGYEVYFSRKQSLATSPATAPSR
jgi:hypothetical protein